MAYSAALEALIAEFEGRAKPPAQGGVLLAAMVRVGAALQVLLREELRHEGLTPLEVEVLRRLSTQPGSSETALAEKLSMKRQSIHEVLCRLRAAELIDSERGGDDRRTVGLWLTAAARERLPPLLERLDALESRILGELSDDERDTLLARLDAITLGLRKEEEHKLWAKISRHYR